MGRMKNNKIWLYFDRISDFAARCKSCKVNLSCKHTSANLVRHLFYKHHVDASYYGAERTGFLKQKRIRKNPRTTTDEEVPHSHATQSVPAAESLFDPLLVVKQEIVPMKLISCSDEQGNGLDQDDTVSIQEYQLPAVSMASTAPQLNTAHNLDDMQGSEKNDYIDNAHNSHPKMLPNAVSLEMHMGTSYEAEKLKAEARYYNEMAELARAKRIMIELQSEKLKLEMDTMRAS